MSPTLRLTNCPFAALPATTSFVPNLNIRPSTMENSLRSGMLSGPIPRTGTFAGASGDAIFGRSMMTTNSAAASGACPSRLIPGACLMTSTSSPLSPLVISLSAPLRMTSARSGEPDDCIAAAKPAAIESTETKTTTTPAMPTIATPDELSRWGMVRTFSARTASVCLIHCMVMSASARL